MARLDDAHLQRWTDRVFCACAVAYGLVLWWPTRDLPYHWDSATFVVDAARDLLASHFHPLLATHSDFAHPPLFVALVAGAWAVFGESRIAAHAVVLPALPLAMIATYRLGTHVADRAVGAIAAFLFGGVAVVVAEYGQVYPDLPIGAATTWAVFAWVTGRKGWAAALLSIAALMKIPGPLTVPAALGILVLASPTQRRDHRAYLALAAPFAVDALWLAYHRAETGWTLWREGRTLAAPQGAMAHVRAVGVVLDWLLLGQWRWVALVAAFLAVASRFMRKRPVTIGPLAPLLMPIAMGVLLFAGVGEFGLRYGIYLLPLYLVACLALVGSVVTRAAWLGVGGAGLFALFVTTWHPTVGLTSSYVFRPDENLAYLDMIRIGLDSAHWLEAKHPDAEIYGAGPESYELTEPWQGYVTSPLQFAACKDFERHPGTTQIVYVHAYHPQQPLCRRITEALGAKVIKHFESNGKWLELYRIPAAE